MKKDVSVVLLEGERVDGHMCICVTFYKKYVWGWLMNEKRETRLYVSSPCFS